MSGALHGIRVVDCSARLPGPLGTLFLAAAGADVVRIEPPGGDFLRAPSERWPQAPSAFDLLHRGKRTIELDLKDADDHARLMDLLADADVFVEGYRRNVAARLGLEFDVLRARFPRLITCSIVGYDVDGPDAARAGHDLTYLAHRGLLSLMTSIDGAPSIPGVLLADVGGGSYPAVVNILLALFARERTGVGTHVTVALADALGPFAVWARATVAGGGEIDPRRGIFTGGSARYGVYRTRDGAWLAVGALEEHFWIAFCTLLAIATDADVATVAAAVALHDEAWFRARLDEIDTCAAIVEPAHVAGADGDLRLPIAPELRATVDRV
jgi:alpha-methylacyl-CoA racemase